LFSLFVAASILWIWNIIEGNLSLLFVPTGMLFLLAGLLGPGIGRTLNITSIERIGVSRSIPLVGIAPFFATIFAILFLGEAYSFYIFAGMALITFGIFVLTRRKEQGIYVFDKRDLLLPLGSAFCGGASIALTKKGLLLLDDPIIGAAIALSAAFVIVLGWSLITGQTKNLRLAPSEITFPFFTGLSMSCAFFLNFTALQIGNVSIVAPIFSTFPLFGVFLSHFFLKEEITGRAWLGAAIIVLGIAVIQVF